MGKVLYKTVNKSKYIEISWILEFFELFYNVILARLSSTNELTNENSLVLLYFLITHIYDGNLFANTFRNEKKSFWKPPLKKKKFSINKTEQ